jgi:DNA-binding MarR family transcriptional regulator
VPNVPARQRPSANYLVLARFRRSLRAVNNAIGRGAAAAGLTFQQQAFLLALAAYGGRAVPLADVREELEMDQPSASALLARLVDMRMVTRSEGRDRRAADVTFTPAGSRAFRESVKKIRDEVRRAEHRAELWALQEDLRAYLTFYLGKGSGTRRKRVAR